MKPGMNVMQRKATPTLYIFISYNQ